MDGLVYDDQPIIMSVEESPVTSPAHEAPLMSVGKRIASPTTNPSLEGADTQASSPESSAALLSTNADCSTKSPPVEADSVDKAQFETPKQKKRMRRSSSKRGLSDTPMDANLTRRRSKRVRRSSLVDPSLLGQSTVLLPPSTVAVTSTNVTTRACFLFPSHDVLGGVRGLVSTTRLVFPTTTGTILTILSFAAVHVRKAHCLLWSTE